MHDEWSADRKVAVITGAGSGMGKASAELFAREGARVLAVDISGAERATASAIGDTVVAFRADISQESDVAAMIAHAVAEFGRVDIVCNVESALPGITAKAAMGRAGRPGEVAEVAAFLASDREVPSHQGHHPGRRRMVGQTGLNTPSPAPEPSGRPASHIKDD